MLTCLFPFTLSLWLVTKKMINWLVCSFKWACYESFKQGGLGRIFWYSDIPQTQPRCRGDVMMPWSSPRQQLLETLMTGLHSQAPELFGCFDTLHHGSGAGEVMSYRVSSFPPPLRLPLTSPLLWLEQLQNQRVVRCFLSIVWSGAARLFTKRLQHQLSAYMKK